MIGDGSVTAIGHRDRSLTILPKAHLHLHLDGAIRSDTVAEIAHEMGIEVPVPLAYGSFAHFMDAIAVAASCLRNEGDVRRVLNEIMEDAKADGAVWVELSMWPGLFRGRLGSDREATELVLDAGRAAGERHNVGFGLVLAANRGLGVPAAMQIAQLAVRLMDSGVVGFGLDGDEAAAPGGQFEEPFRVARGAGLLAVPHAGECLGASSVRTAIDLLGADRVMHGVRAIEDQQVIDELARRETTLDVCPTSNLLVGVVPAIEAHPLPQLLRAGVHCSINADDPFLFGTSLSKEYDIARIELGLTDPELATAARASIRGSAAPDSIRTRALGGIDSWLNESPSAKQEI